ncbi:hypothetical protein N0V90_005649 [Kalmusia sp. IMI 367209]|nr:hypothetical protein N0V90_005649 [Kalmusia sp. IMI 367209]
MPKKLGKKERSRSHEKQGYDDEHEQDSRRGKSRGRSHATWGNKRNDSESDGPIIGDSNRYHHSPGLVMTGGASGNPLSSQMPIQPSAQPKYGPLTTSRDEDGCSGSEPTGRSRSRFKQRFDHNGNPLIRGNRGWRDASPGPFPEYKFEKGPLLGLGRLAKDRFKWGVHNYESQQRRKERRARGSLKERKKAHKEKFAERKKDSSCVEGKSREEKDVRHFPKRRAAFSPEVFTQY